MFCLLVDVLYLICSSAQNVPLILFFYFSFISTKNLNKIKAVCASFYFVVAAAFAGVFSDKLVNTMETGWYIITHVQVVVLVP